MTGEMSRADLTEDGEWGLFVHTARLLKTELLPFDVYQGPYLYYNGHKLWFSNNQKTGEWDHGIWDDTDDTFHSLGRHNPWGFGNIIAAELARFIRKEFK